MLFGCALCCGKTKKQQRMPVKARECLSKPITYQRTQAELQQLIDSTASLPFMTCAAAGRTTVTSIGSGLSNTDGEYPSA